MTEQINVLITGASGGLGSTTALMLADEGYKLALHIHHHDERSESLAAELKSKGALYQFIEAELTDESSVIKLVDDAATWMKGIQVVINIAGIPFSSMSWKQSLDEWNHIMAVNATAPWLVSRYAFPHMRKNAWGRLIHFSSVVAHRPPAGTSAYAASKAALEGLTRAQANELSRFGITVNCIAPGYFDAGMIDSVSADYQQKLVTEIPAGRLGNPAELAHWLLYLCSEKSAYTTGQVLHINGGLYL